MMTRAIVIGSIVMMLAQASWGAEKGPVRFDFEKGKDGWSIPEWCQDQKDCAIKDVSLSREHAKSGGSSLKLDCNFPGTYWASAIVEYENDLDLRGYKSISADVYIPENPAAKYLTAKIIVTAGDQSKWIEMRTPVPLEGGAWVTVKAPLETTESGEMKSWVCNTKEECVVALLDKIKRIAIRIEYDVNVVRMGPPYKGAVYIDDVVIE